SAPNTDKFDFENRILNLEENTNAGDLGGVDMSMTVLADDGDWDASELVMELFEN
ncbi:hypothetical protein HK096_003394, partial [Nowakowskiella sp. JEL0078]